MFFYKMGILIRVIKMYYLNIFFISSFLGYLVETFLKKCLFHSMNNGILFGPWIPIYGFGCIIIVLLEKLIFEKVKVKDIFKILMLFISVVIFITILEWIGGILIEILFDKIFWDYSQLKFNIGHYIALEMSLVWGLGSMLFIFLIKPLEDLIVKKIPKWLTILVSLLFVVDLIITTLKLI